MKPGSLEMWHGGWTKDSGELLEPTASVLSHFHVQVWSINGYILRGYHEGHTAPVTCLATDANFLFR